MKALRRLQKVIGDRIGEAQLDAQSIASNAGQSYKDSFDEAYSAYQEEIPTDGVSVGEGTLIGMSTWFYEFGQQTGGAFETPGGRKNALRIARHGLARTDGLAQMAGFLRDECSGVKGMTQSEWNQFIDLEKRSGIRGSKSRLFLLGSHKSNYSYLSLVMLDLTASTSGIGADCFERSPTDCVFKKGANHDHFSCSTGVGCPHATPVCLL
jgi:hypothetical protein